MVNHEPIEVLETCPDCGNPDLYGPTHDFLGQSCPECGWGNQWIMDHESDH